MNMPSPCRFRSSTLFWAFPAFFLCAVVAAPVARAVPYLGIGSYTYHQPDGSTCQVKLYGDEFFAYQRTLDGQEVVRDPQSGYLCYAGLAADGRSFVSTGIPVVSTKAGSQGANRTQALAAGAAPANQTLPPDAIIASVRAAQAEHQVDEHGVPLSPATGATQQSPAGGAAPNPPSRSTVGNFVSLCILVDFPDQAGTISQAQVDNFCNQPSGYAEFGNACSVNEYYRIQSEGRFNLVNIVTAYVTMPKSKTYYDDNQPYSSGKAKELVSTALDMLVSQSFDFTALTCDGSGFITSINVFYAGTCASDWSKGLWPHSGGISTKVVDVAHNIKASHYQMSDMKNALEIGTFCHENGHMVCLYPDLYSYVNSASITGYYSLMCSGSWGGGDGSHPTNVDPYLKIKSGWADVIEVDSSSHLRATAQADRNFFYKYANPSDSGEYFLIENRDSSGYEGPYGGSSDTVVPGRGLTVWQVYEDGDNTYSSIQQTGTYATPYEAMIVEASPTGSYSPWYSAPSPYPNSSDTFYSGHGANPLNDSSSPDLHFWDHSGSASGRTVSSGMVIHSYGAQGPAVSFTIGSGAVSGPPAIGVTTTKISASCEPGQNADDQVFEVFNSGGGTLDYTVTDNAAWLSCTPGSGSVTSGAQSATVSFDSSALSVGYYTATITVSDPGASNSPVSIPVTLTVASPFVATMQSFVWDPIPSPRMAGSPFGVTVTAVDSLGRTVTDFNGMAILSGVVSHTVGTGTGGATFPMGTWYHDERTQVIYLAGELGGAQTLDSLSLYVTTPPGQTMNAWTIRMKHTALSTYASASWEGSGWTTVYQANQSVSSTGWVKFDFSTPFDYDGVSNLMVDFSFNNSTYTSNGVCRYSTPGGNRTVYYQTDSVYGDPLTWSGTAQPGTMSSAVPNIKVGDDTPVTVSPTAGGSFVGGVWTGTVTVPSGATGMVLRADDGNGHTGDSNAFDALPDTTPPTGTILINNNRSATNSRNVILTLTWDDGTDGSGVVRMRFSDDGAHWSVWEPLAATRPYTLPAGPDGHKTVRVQYLDKANNRSAVYHDYIRLDTTPPTGTIIINGGALTTDSRDVMLGLTWNDGDGALVSRMRFSDDGAHWTAWMPPETPHPHHIPGPTGYNTVRVQYLDGAGNYSAVFNDYIKLLAP